MKTVKISISAMQTIQQKMKGKGESVGFNTPDDVAAYIRKMRKQKITFRHLCHPVEILNLHYTKQNMKKNLTILMLFGVVYAYAQDTPPHAASTMTWTFGEQTWSDAIQIPECNKEDFPCSDTVPQCRSYTEDEKTYYYYYNWAYVNKNTAKLCPVPWHVPTKDDFETLDNSTNSAALGRIWGFGGFAGVEMFYPVGAVDTHAVYWSSTLYVSLANSAYVLSYSFNYLGVRKDSMVYGFLVRCVK
jgi:hypothetical protein